MFGDHKVSGLILYNQSRNYYPDSYTYLPRNYVGLVGRATYAYQSKYLLDVNVGYNGSENFAPGSTRFGIFPSFLSWLDSHCREIYGKPESSGLLKAQSFLGTCR